MKCCEGGQVQDPLEANEFFDAYRANDPRYVLTEAGLAALEQLDS